MSGSNIDLWLHILDSLNTFAFCEKYTVFPILNLIDVQHIFHSTKKIVIRFETKVDTGLKHFLTMVLLGGNIHVKCLQQ